MRDHFRKIHRKSNLSATFRSGLSFPGAALTLDQVIELKEHADKVKEKQVKSAKIHFSEPANRRKQLFAIANTISKNKRSKSKIKLAHFSIEDK